MGYIERQSRDQMLLLPASVDDYVAADNAVRFIAAFVDDLDLGELGFDRFRPKATGRPGYDPADLLKLYLYGYLNRVRSSRCLAAEAGRNLEVIWLLGGLRPDFRTIADFRRVNRPAFKPLFRAFVLLCRKLDLFGRELVAVDGTRLKAVNSRKRNFTQQKLAGWIKLADERIEEYLGRLDRADRTEIEAQGAARRAATLEAKLARVRTRRELHQAMLTELVASGESQLSLTDPDARGMAMHPKVGVGYNAQVAVDARYKLIVEQNVTNSGSDLGFLAQTAGAAREVLGVERIDAVADKGYYKGEDIAACEDIGVVPYVARPQRGSAVASGYFNRTEFRYDPEADCYVCPSGDRLDPYTRTRKDEHISITEDRTRFPLGLKALGDYIHSKRLKFGIYSDAGTKTCGGRPGSQGHEYQDAQQYARWGVDYLKYDWCSTGVRNPEEAYALMSDALKASGRPILFSMCEWGNSKPWLWASKIGNMWRTTGDITDKWQGKYNYSWGIASIVDMNEPLWPYAGPGHWNDPDMLEVGNGGLTDVEYRAHFSLWAMMAAPLIAGNDLATMTDATRTILLNRDVIAVDQDPLGKQGHRVTDKGDLEVWSKPMADGGRTVLLWNRGTTPARIAAEWPALGLPGKLRLKAQDLWTKKNLGQVSARYEADVAPHGVVMVRLKP